MVKYKSLCEDFCKDNKSFEQFVNSVFTVTPIKPIMKWKCMFHRNILNVPFQSNYLNDSRGRELTIISDKSRINSVQNSVYFYFVLYVFNVIKVISWITICWNYWGWKKFNRFESQITLFVSKHIYVHNNFVYQMKISVQVSLIGWWHIWLKYSNPC